MTGVGLQPAVTAGLALPVSAAAAAQHLPEHKHGGGAAPGAGQARESFQFTEARAPAGGTAPGQTPHQAETKPADARHPGRIAVGPHVGFQQGLTIGRGGGGPPDGLPQVVGVIEIAPDCGAIKWHGRTHEHAVTGMADPPQPGRRVCSGCEAEVGKIGAWSEHVLLHHQILLLIAEYQPLLAHRQQRKQGVRTEAALAGETAGQTGGRHSLFGLEATGLAGWSRTGPLAIKRAQGIGVDVGEDQRQPEREAERTPQRLVLAVSSGQGHRGSPGEGWPGGNR